MEQKKELSWKESLFIDNYLIDYNATRAYSEVYNKTGNNVRTFACELVAKPRIKEEIDKRTKERGEEFKDTREKLLKELCKVALVDIRNFAEVYDGRAIVKDTADWPDNYASAVTSIKQGKSGVEIKLADKGKAMELLGRHLGLYVDKVEHSGEVGIRKVEDLLRDVQGDKF